MPGGETKVCRKLERMDVPVGECLMTPIPSLLADPSQPKAMYDDLNAKRSAFAFSAANAGGGVAVAMVWAKGSAPLCVCNLIRVAGWLFFFCCLMISR